MFSDQEYRILLAAMRREREVCERVDKEANELGCDLGNLLVGLCDSIEKKLSDIQHDQHEYVWHDLRKNPNDLPKDLENVLICIKGLERYKAGVTAAVHNKRAGLWGNGSCSYKDREVVAWKYIDPFEGE